MMNNNNLFYEWTVYNLLFSPKIICGSETRSYSLEITCQLLHTALHITAHNFTGEVCL